MNLTSRELAALHQLTMYKPCARAEYLARIGVGYSPADPTIAKLIACRFVEVRGKSLCPDKAKIREELALHRCPPGYFSELEGWTRVFAYSPESDS